MKRIVLCFDGTWNRPADDNQPEDQQVETNVRRFYESVQKKDGNGVEQAPWYNRGVGTGGWDELVGGATGAGLDFHIMDGYRHLMNTYEDGDELYIVGFSRGAYTARSLVGLLRNCGLVKKSSLRFEWMRKAEDETRLWSAYGLYRARDDGSDSVTARAFREAFSRPIRVKFLGVWDTVGALGIPLNVAKGLNKTYYQFHDTQLSNIVDNAFHAIAIDEHRDTYDVCLWTPSTSPAQALEQRWFPGAHSDVGGGYASRALSDLSLRWMQEKAEALDLALTLANPGERGFAGELTDSYAQFLGGKFAKLRQRYFRTILASNPFGREVLDTSVDLRRRDAALKYGPTNPGLLALGT